VSEVRGQEDKGKERLGDLEMGRWRNWGTGYFDGSDQKTLEI
jgi:hypothetical protein